MIRSLSLLILLAASPVLLAQPLYKWVEADGSITFSVEPPPEGVVFETIEPDSGEAATLTPAETPAITPPSLAQGLPATPAGTINRSTSEISSQASSRTLSGSGNNLQPTDASTARFSEAAGNISYGHRNGNRAVDAPVMSSESEKERQCEDLQKRIVSLERRLRQTLSPDDMDNTVVYMAKYQRSLNQYCVQ